MEEWILLLTLPQVCRLIIGKLFVQKMIWEIFITNILHLILNILTFL